jgi:uncharacterized membrane protein (UPF0127 family)
VLRRMFVAFALASLLMSQGLSFAQEEPAPREDTLVIESRKGTELITVEIADTSALRERGLMFRHRLAPGKGMLFLYEAAQPVAMWMKNTYISLDMAFVRADGTVARIVEGAVPHSLDTIESGEPVAAVLEVAAGQAEALGIEPGTLIRHGFFGNAD